MRRLLASGLALALAVVAVAILAGTPAAQTGTRGSGTCGPDAREIPAADVPEGTGRCETGGRPIVDGVAGAVLPPPGEGVYVEALTREGAQELEVVHLQSGEVEVNHVGDEAGETQTDLFPAGARATRECQNPSYQGSGWKVVEKFRYRVNLGSTPREIGRSAAATAIRRAGANVADTRNGCRMGDRVPVGLSYEGKTSRYPDRQDGHCTRSDDVSVVAFGDLPNAAIPAVTCTYFDLAAGPNPVTSSDVKLNKVDFRWTTGPGSRSCYREWDLQGVMTHERGHTFGLSHVPELGNRNLTMSPVINGPCQATERTLGRGDVLGLDARYP